MREKVPEADLILSNWALNLVGHPDYMVRKIAHSLNLGGIAILHFNAHKLYGQMKNFSSFLDKLCAGEIKIQGCEVKGLDWKKIPDYIIDTVKAAGNHLPEDTFTYLVLIKKLNEI